MEYSPKKMQETLDCNGFKFKKNFGQNFIIDKNIIDNIIRNKIILVFLVKVFQIILFNLSIPSIRSCVPLTV